MNNPTQATLFASTSIAPAALRTLFSLMLAAGTAASVRAQGQLASGTVSGSGTGPFTYSLSFGDAAGATSPIGSIWYAWVPGFFYLPSSPTSASAPAGWSALIDGNSIQFTANSVANDITPGESLSGFGYDANFSPAQLEAAPNSASSYAYSGGLFSDPGQNFNVQTVPEPSTLMLLTFGATELSLIARRKLRAA